MKKLNKLMIKTRLIAFPVVMIIATLINIHT